MDEREEQLELLAKAAKTFSPGAPIDKGELFAGRKDQVMDVINAIMQRGQHVILFGERGVGKTSLANVLYELLSKAGLEVMGSKTINCDSTDDFSSLWHKIFREIRIAVETRPMGFTAPPTEEKVVLDSLLPKKVAPDDVRYMLQRFTGHTILIIDEIDRIGDQETTTLLADTIKTLSDHSVDTTVILAGVADSVGELVAEHQSIERALVQVRMPRMSRAELLEILDRGFSSMEMTADEGVKEQIASLSQGLPHYTHLLGLHTAQQAIKDDRTHMKRNDLNEAIRIALSKAQQSIIRAHHKATSSARKTLYAEVLLACALAETDDLGYFAAADVRGPMSDIMGKPYDIPAFSRHLNDFCEAVRGPILQKTGSVRRFRFRFINPLMEPFVIVHGLAKGLISEDTFLST